jgi:hypothetical protein
VITYPAGNAGELAGRVTEVLVSRERIVRDMPRPLIADTLADEIRVLTEG